MAKEKVLKDPIAYKVRENSFTFNAPRKEQTTTGRFMAAGSNYGVGRANPIGHQGKVKSYDQGPVPGEACCFHSDEAIRR